MILHVTSQRLFRFLRTLGGVCLFSYIAVCLLLWFIQDRLVYPAASPVPWSSIEGRMKDEGLKSVRNAGGTIVGFEAIDEKPATRGTMIACHTSAIIAVDRKLFIDALNPRGFQVILYEFPGYGGREGRPNEQQIQTELRELVRHALEQGKGPVYLCGESLGTGAVGLVPDQHTPIAGIILITPFDSLTHAAEKIAPYIPVGWLLSERYNTVENLKTYRGPIYVAQVDHDGIVNADCTENLCRQFPATQIKRITFLNRGHAQWPSESDNPWWDEAVSFITAPSS